MKLGHGKKGSGKWDLVAEKPISEGITQAMPMAEWGLDGKCYISEHPLLLWLTGDEGANYQLAVPPEELAALMGWLRILMRENRRVAKDIKQLKGKGLHRELAALHTPEGRLAATGKE